MIERLSAGEARYMALAAQGFGWRPRAPGRAHVLALLDRLGLFQIDSVNVLVRAHYLPAFSRLGAYDRALLDNAAWGPSRSRRSFEYWAHEASLLPLAMQPLLRWRMERADRGSSGYPALRHFASERRGEAMAVLDRIRGDGPLAASDLETGRSGWWTWSNSKRALEWLFWAGHITTATRRRGFERVYDLTERVIPATVRAMPTPSPEDAIRTLVDRAARSYGIGTAADLRDYFRLSPADTATAIASLVEAGTLRPVAVEGWRPPAFLHRDAKLPRRVAGHALLAPFDPLIWSRARAERLFGFRYRIEIYTPADRRVHGYYVLPFLLGDRLVSRVDLKADRVAGVLHVRGTHHEPGAPPGTDAALADELRLMADWLGLDRIA